MATLAELMEQYAAPTTAVRRAPAPDAEHQAYLDGLRRRRLAREAEHERIRGRTLGEVTQDAAVQLLGKGAVGLGQAAFGVGNIATGGVLDRVTGMSENFDRTNEILNAALSDPTQRDLGEVREAFDEGFLPGMGALLTEPAALQDLAFSNAAQVIPGAAVGTRAAQVAKFAGKNADDVAAIAGRAAVRTSGGQAAGSTNVEAINAIREAGGSEELQQFGGLGAGVSVGVVNPLISKAVGTDKLYGNVLGRMAGTPTTRPGGVVRNIGTGALRETAEETLQSGGEQIAQNVPAPGVDAFEDLGMAMGMGGVAGAMLGGSLGAFQGVNIRSDNEITNAGNAGLDEISGELGVDVRDSASPLTRTPVRDATLARLQSQQVEEPGGGFQPMSAVAQVMQEIFTVEQDDNGDPHFFAYDPDIQSFQEVDADTAMRTAQLVMERQQQAAGLPLAEVQELDNTDVDLGDTPVPGANDPLPLPGVETIGETIPQTEDIVSTIERVTGQRRGTQLSQKDLVRAEDIVREQLFRQETDPVTGDTQYLEYDPALQRLVEVPQTEVDKAVKAHLRQVQEKPAKSWKQWTAKNFGLKPSQLTGKTWKQFADAADEAGVKPGEPGANAFLEAQAALLAADPNTTSQFAAELGSRYAAEPALQADAEEIAATAETVATEQAQDEATAAEQITEAQSTKAAVEAAEAAPTSVESGAAPLAPEPEPPTTPDIEVVRAERAIAKRVKASNRPRQFARPNAIRQLLNAANGASDLDETFNAVKMTEAWKSLEPGVQDDVAQHFSDLYDELESAGRFSRVDTTPDTVIDEADFNAILDKAQANKPTNGADLVGFDTVESYRQATGNAAPDDTAGVYYDGVAYLIRENTPDASALVANVLHEHGHRGLEGLLGDRLTAVTNRMWANPALRSRIDAKRERYKDEKGNKLDRSTAAEEVLVDMIVGKEKLNKNTFAKIRSAIDAGALRLAGVRGLTVSDNDVDKVLTNSAAWLRGMPLDAKSTAEDDVMMAELDALIGDPRRAESSPRYSRTLAGMDDALAAATNSEKRSRALNDYAEAGVKEAKHVVSKSSNSVFKTVLKAVPLSQMSNLYSRLWDDTGAANPLEMLSKEVRNKESSFNQSTTRKKKVKYRGKDAYNVSPRELADEWYTLSRKDEAQGKLVDFVQQYGTLYHVWPDAAWADQTQNLFYERLGFTEADRKAAHAKIRDAWNKMSPEAQGIYKKSQALYQHMTETQYQELANELERSSNRQEGDPVYDSRLKGQIEAEINALKSGPYSPLRRFGDFLVTTRDEQGEVVDFRGFDREDEAQAFKADTHARLVDEGRNDWSVSATKKANFQREVDGVNHAVIQQMEQKAEAALSQLTLDESDRDHIRANMKSALAEIYLKQQPEHSLLSHANRRKGVDGFNMNSMRAFSDYAIKTATRTASLKHDGNASRALLAMNSAIRAEGRKPVSDPTQKDLNKMTDVWNAVRAQRSASLRQESSPLADKLSAGSFYWFMTSPSQMFVNAMQTPMVAFPRLAATYRGFGGSSAKALVDGMKVFAQSRGDLTREDAKISVGVKQVMQSLHEDGTLDFTLAHDMTSVAKGDFEAMSPHWRGATKVMTFAIHQSEMFNRQVTAYAAVQLEARKRGLDLNAPLDDANRQEITDIAAKFVADTHFTYSRSDKAEFMQGPWRRVILQFQHYRLNMLAMLARDVRDSFSGSPEEKATARRALAWIIGGQAAFAGASGTVLAPVAFFIADMFRDEDDLLSSQTEFNRFVPQWVAHGLMSGAIDTTRVSGGQLIPFFGDRAYAPTEGSAREQFNYHLSQNAGPWAGLLTDVATGIEKTIEGDYMGGVQGMMPKPFKDMLKAVDSSDGVKDSRDIVYFEPGAWDNFTQAVGLKSGARREAEERRSGGYEASIRRSKLRSRILGKIALGAGTGDGALQQEGFADLDRWNAANPGDPIGKDSVRSAIRQRATTQAQALATGLTTNNLPPSVQRLLEPR